MKIITELGTIDTNTDFAALIFEDDDELNLLLSRLATKDVKTSGVRVFPLIPNKGLNIIQLALLDVINGFDGAGCNNNKEHQDICDNTIDGIKNIIKNF